MSGLIIIFVLGKSLHHFEKLYNIPSEGPTNIVPLMNNSCNIYEYEIFRAAAMRSFLMPLVAVVILGIAVTSCSKDRALFDAIPAEVDNVGFVRLKSVLSQSGFKFGPNGVTTDGLAAPEGRFRDLVDLADVMDRSGVCDIDRMARARDRDGVIYVTARSATATSLPRLLPERSDGLRPKTVSGRASGAVSRLLQATAASG